MSTKWGTYESITMTWGTSKWGEGTNPLRFDILKLIDNSLGPTITIGNSATHLLENSLTPTSDMSDLYLQDAAGFYYVFVSNTTDSDERDDVTYTSAAVASTTYSSQTVTTTSWTST